MSRRKQILLVEDDADVRGQIALLIELLGYEVHMAGNVEEARAKFRSHSVDLVISDLWMPGGAATELLDEFHEAKHTVPVIILTGMPTQESIRESITHDVFAYVAKPLQGDQLRVLIERALGDKAAHKDAL